MLTLGTGSFLGGAASVTGSQASNASAALRLTGTGSNAFDFTGFRTLEVTQGASWSLSGNGGFADGATLAAGASLANGGIITTQTGLVASMDGSSATVLTNSGVIRGTGGAAIVASTGTGAGPAGAISITNTGSLLGSGGRSIDIQVAKPGAAVTLTLGTGSVLGGAASVTGSTPSTAALRLTGTGSNAFDFTGFRTLDVTQGASWSLSGNGSFADGATLAAGASLANAGIITTQTGLVAGMDGSSTTVLANSGVIRGIGGAAIKAGTGDGPGGAISITNTGTLLGGNDKAIDIQVDNSDAAIILTLGTGSYLGGAASVAGDATPSVAALRLTGTGSEDLTKFTGLNTLEVTQGASWGLTGGSRFAGGIVNNGTLAPGSGTVGTLALEGDFTQAGGAALQIAATTDGGVSKLEITGRASLGGTVRVVGGARASSPKDNPPASILSATGGLTGRFANVSANFAFLVPTLTYEANDVLLSFAVKNLDYAAVAATANQASIGRALNVAAELPGNPLRPILERLDVETVEGARRTLDTLGTGAESQSGQGEAIIALGRHLTRSFLQPVLSSGALAGQLAQAPTLKRVRYAQAGGPIATDATPDGPAPVGSLGLWSNVFGSFGAIGSGMEGRGATGFTAGGLAFGADTPLTPEITLGVAGGYAVGDLEQDALSAESDVRSGSAALYAGWRRDKAHVAATVGYAYSDIDARRTLDVGAGPARAEGRTHANQMLSELEVGYEAARLAEVRLTPFVGLQGSVLWQAGYTEDGAGAANLAVDGSKRTSLRTVAGVKAARTVTLDEGREIEVSLKAGWAHAVKDGAPATSARFAAAPAAGFTLAGTRGQKDAALVGLGIGAVLGEAVTGYVRYDGELGPKDRSTTFSAGLRLTW
jgi:outer membrane autotransporter protein